MEHDKLPSTEASRLWTEDDLLKSHDALYAESGPYAHAFQIVQRLDDLCDSMSSTGLPGSGHFFECVFNKLWARRSSGEEQELVLENWDNQPPDMRPFALLQLIWIACAYAMDAIRLNKESEAEAWRAVSKSQYWLGVASGSWSIRKDQPQTIVSFAKKGAEVRHAASNRARAFVQAEWVRHRDAYEQNKSAFTRDYVKRVFNEFDVTVTEKQMREVWLKDTPSAGKPDGMPADGE